MFNTPRKAKPRPEGYSFHDLEFLVDCVERRQGNSREAHKMIYRERLEAKLISPEELEPQLRTQGISSWAVYQALEDYKVYYHSDQRLYV